MKSKLHYHGSQSQKKKKKSRCAYSILSFNIGVHYRFKHKLTDSVKLTLVSMEVETGQC